MSRTPYTQIGIRRKKCVRCGGQATQQWSICSLGSEYHPLCLRCDVELNRLVLKFMKWPGASEIIRQYKDKME